MIKKSLLVISALCILLSLGCTQEDIYTGDTPNWSISDWYFVSDNISHINLDSETLTVTAKNVTITFRDSEGNKREFIGVDNITITSERGGKP